MNTDNLSKTTFDCEESLHVLVLSKSNKLHKKDVINNKISYIIWKVQMHNPVKLVNAIEPRIIRPN